MMTSMAEKGIIRKWLISFTLARSTVASHYVYNLPLQAEMLRVVCISKHSNIFQMGYKSPNQNTQLLAMKNVCLQIFKYSFPLNI